MSFCVDLWNGFKAIKSSFNSNLNIIDQLIYILDSYSIYIKGHSKNLINLYESINKFIKKDDNIFNDSLYLLITSFKRESDYYQNHYNLITSSVKEIKEKLEKIKLNTQQYFQSNDKNTENFNNVF